MVHDPLDAEDLADKIKTMKTEDHAVDALRYGVMAENGINVTRDLAGLASNTLPIVRHTGNGTPRLDPKLEGMFGIRR
jgi:cell division protein ZapA (FtsZ GTPase activity inhibitor)